MRGTEARANKASAPHRTAHSLPILRSAKSSRTSPSSTLVLLQRETCSPGNFLSHLQTVNGGTLLGRAWPKGFSREVTPLTWPQFQPGGQRLQWGWGRQVPLNQAAKTPHPTPSAAWPRTHIKSSMNRTLVSGRAGGRVKAPGAFPLWVPEQDCASLGLCILIWEIEG